MTILPRLWISTLGFLSSFVIRHSEFTTPITTGVEPMMMPLLAQTTVPAGLAAWLACAAFILMLANQAFRLKERLLGERRPQEIFPQPLEIKTASGPVTREYCDSNYHANVQRIKAIEQELTELRNERREAAAKLEKKIELAGREINELERRLNAANEARFEKVHTRINEVLGEIRELRGELNQI